MTDNQPPFSAQIRAGIEWWKGAGVDLDFHDSATNWLEQEAAPAPVKPQPTSQKSSSADAPSDAETKPDLLGTNPPVDLAAFHEWWLTEPALDKIGPRGRIAPQGKANSELMILVVSPEECDRQRLLSGSQGKLLDSFLHAAGLARDEIYVASALPRHAPVVDGQSLITAGYGDILKQHIMLASPRRVLGFGRNILPLLRHEAAQESDNLGYFNHKGVSLPFLVAEGLDSMQAMPRLKAKFWRKWLDWTDG